ncbi:hypothetical protein MUG87_19560 [Ectobacillus sp. JY-23]|uniref:hypothetical protein n=1 Tax=Ectobacillus sp. JY-23 TaxID=2933872 RepID=UPI001FF163F1|nr:hypothetical protein [Ectobacillus sp. JY-23]UOY92575.1 hypothetical protein MUG87_19560 [Ectobacillus sp. JY-23]
MERLIVIKDVLITSVLTVGLMSGCSSQEKPPVQSKDTANQTIVKEEKTADSAPEKVQEAKPVVKQETQPPKPIVEAKPAIEPKPVTPVIQAGPKQHIAIPFTDDEGTVYGTLSIETSFHLYTKRVDEAEAKENGGLYMYAIHAEKDGLDVVVGDILIADENKESEIEPSWRRVLKRVHGKTVYVNLIREAPEQLADHPDKLKEWQDFHAELSYALETMN